MPREHDFRGVFMGSEKCCQNSGNRKERGKKVKKRALAILLALCIAAVNITGAFAAATEGTEQQTAEEVTGAGESAEEAQEAEAAETVKEPEEADTDAAPAHTEKEQPEEDKADGAATAQAAEGTAAPDGEEQEIIEDVDPSEVIRSAMDQAIESYTEIGDGNEAEGAISGSAVTNMNKLISYISGNGESFGDGVKGISLDSEKFDGGQYMPMILLYSSRGLVAFVFVMMFDGSTQPDASVFLYYSIDNKEFEGVDCTLEGDEFYFESYADIKEETYLRNQELSFTLRSVGGFTDEEAYKHSQDLKDTAFIAYEKLLYDKVGLSLYALGFQKYIVMSRVECSIPSGSYVHTGSAVKPAVKVNYLGSTLKQGVHYKLVYKDNVNVGIGSVTVEAINGLSGSATLSFAILPAATKKVTIYNVAQGLKVTWQKVPGANRYMVYRDGKAIKITSGLEITDGYVKSGAGKKFTYKVVAMAKDLGESTVSRTGTYYRLIPVGIKSVTNSGPGRMTVTYDKSAGSSGYVVRFGLKGDMSDAKVITVKGAGTLSRTFSGLAKGKTYYVQVRTYKIDNGIRYYSGYCTTKRVTITK